MEKLKVHKKELKLVIIAFIIGAFWLLALRFVLYTRESTHYHANFAVFIEEQRLPFDSPFYYEEVQSCGGDDLNNPKIRAHMHDQVNHIVHVHDEAATWGHFFANVGMTDGDTVFRYDGVVYVEDEDTQIRFILNGDEVETTANRTIRSEDTLLISVGSPTREKLDEQYAEISQDAGEYNQRADPSACTGSKELTLSERLETAVRFWE